jgi:hypothetical protein
MVAETTSKPIDQSKSIIFRKCCKGCISINIGNVWIRGNSLVLSSVDDERLDKRNCPWTQKNLFPFEIFLINFASWVNWKKRWDF